MLLLLSLRSLTQLRILLSIFCIDIFAIYKCTFWMEIIMKKKINDIKVYISVLRRIICIIVVIISSIVNLITNIMVHFQYFLDSQTHIILDLHTHTHTATYAQAHIYCSCDTKSGWKRTLFIVTYYPIVIFWWTYYILDIMRLTMILHPMHMHCKIFRHWFSVSLKIWTQKLNFLLLLLLMWKCFLSIQAWWTKHTNDRG